jgi:signal transduction histidine kinase/ActR/RegA family two-component response regulator
MDCERAFLSLIDTRNQFVCAEMTRRQSLTAQDSTQPLLLGVSSIALEWGVCPYTMSVFSGKPVTLPDSPYIAADSEYFCIKDFRRVPSFATRPYVEGYPAMVSYLEVPLRSASGHIIGSYCVIDNRLRDFLDPKALDTMREITAAISGYLDMKRVEISRTRSEKMMDGLRQFIDSERDTYSLGNSDTKARKVSTGPFDLHVFRQPLQVHAGRESDQNGDGGQFVDVNGSGTQPLGQTDEHLDYPSRPQMSALDGPSTTAPVNLSSHSSTARPSNAEQPSAHDPASPSLEHQHDTPKPQLPDLATQISDLFAKASDMIGYALSLDGLTFFDATSSGTQYRSSHLSSMSSDVAPLQPTIHEDVLAKPLSEYRSRDATKGHLKIVPTQSLIKRLTAEFPQGHVFAMDEYGVFDYGDDHPDNVGAANNREPPDSENWDELFKCIPGARYVAFLPLWHYQREACFATCLAWVTDTGKSLDPADINSLTGFANSLIAEIMRLEAFTNTRSKSDFISSISHELRSPLHGILATVELMQQSTADPELLSLVDMVESCSNTLLHTFDHLLEFTRINSRTNDERRSGHNPSLYGAVDDTTKGELVDLGLLIEDVLETVALSHSSAKQMSLGLEKEHRTASDTLTPNDLPQPVLVTTYIDKDRDWVLPLDKGAWKRIMLNLCSNALKYTNIGHIDVALNLLEGTDLKGSYVSLSVTDTGIGMSLEFLKYHLFTPFTQENILTPGTGLGLSLVKSIVESIHGKIFVESRLHEGTRVTINVPLNRGQEQQDRPKLDESFTRLQGLSLGMLRITSGDGSPRSEIRVAPPSKVLERCVRNICGEMYAMEVTDLSVHTLPKVDVVLVDMRSFIIPAGFNVDMLFPKVSGRTRATAVVVVGPPIQGLHKVFGASEATYLTSPITRKRLRDAFVNALDRANTAAPSLNMPEVVNEITASLQDTSIENDASVDKDRPTDTLHEQTSSGSADVKGIITPPDHSPSQNAITPNPAVPSVTKPDLPTNTSRFKRYLLVDDNPINLKVLSAFIKRLHAPFSLATNGAEAVAIYKRAILDEHDPFDICFMDISMPVQNGVQAVAAIREFEDEMTCKSKEGNGVVIGERCYVLALTGLGSKSAREEAKGAGFDEFLLKPVRFGDVLPLLMR